MKITLPTFSLVALAITPSLFLMASRVLTVSPVLHLLPDGHRVSLLPVINLAQISEFSLIIFTFVITSTVST